MLAMPPNPAASAARARATIWSMVSRICGRKSQNSSGLFTGELLVSTRPGSACRRRRRAPMTRGPEDIYGSPAGNNRSRSRPDEEGE